MSQTNNRRYRKYDLFIMILSASFILIGLLIQIGYLDPNPDPYQKRRIDFDTLDRVDENRKFTGNAFMSAKLFSANMPIHVKVTLDVEKGDKSPKVAYVYFHESTSLPHENMGIGDQLRGGVIEAKLDSDGLYRGEHDIEYDMEGCYFVEIYTVCI